MDLVRRPPGERLNAKFDGKDYPVEDDPGRMLVSAKLLNADTVELTCKRNGEVVAIKRISVMLDRKSIDPSICGNIRPDWTESSAKWKTMRPLADKSSFHQNAELATASLPPPALVMSLTLDATTRSLHRRSPGQSQSTAFRSWRRRTPTRAPDRHANTRGRNAQSRR